MRPDVVGLSAVLTDHNRTKSCMCAEDWGPRSRQCLLSDQLPILPVRPPSSSSVEGVQNAGRCSMRFYSSSIELEGAARACASEYPRPDLLLSHAQGFGDEAFSLIRCLVLRVILSTLSRIQRRRPHCYALPHLSSISPGSGCSGEVAATARCHPSSANGEPRGTPVSFCIPIFRRFCEALKTCMGTHATVAA